ncbi:MAG: biotin--[acetyl-CoA-carboxylase] ligase [Treponema sp.]
MVNNTLSTKYKILELLRNSSGNMSGESIAIKTGVSRVSVWKAVQSLQEAGYGISSTKNGYCLENDLQDSLYPWEFGEDENQFIHFAQTKSTMIEAHRIAEEDSSNSCSKIITSDKQTEGQGHNNHKWVTTKGSLAYTVITHNKLSVSESHRITMASQIALANVLTKIDQRKFYVRWPNDVWSEKGKVAGVLDELSASGSLCRWINLGVGVNLTKNPSIASTDFVCSNKKSFTRKEVLSLFLKEFNVQEKIATENSSELANEWDKLCFDKKKEVRLSSNGKKYIFKGIDNYGWIKLSSNESNEKIVLPPGTDSFIKK